MYIQVGVKKEGEEMVWTEYTAEEARDGLKKLNATRGPRFDYVSAPAIDGSNSERGMEGEKKKRKRLPAAASSTSCPWVPPARQGGNDWRPPTKDAMSEDADDL